MKDVNDGLHHLPHVTQKWFTSQLADLSTRSFCNAKHVFVISLEGKYITLDGHPDLRLDPSSTTSYFIPHGLPRKSDCFW